MFKDFLKSQFAIFQKVMILFILYAMIFLGMFSFLVDSLDKEIKGDRKNAEEKIEYLEKNIVIQDGNLKTDKKESFIIGNRELLILIDNEKDYSKEELLEILKDKKLVYGIVFGDTEVSMNTKNGFKEVNYENIETESNIKTGADVIQGIGLNSYTYEYIYGYMFTLFKYFSSSMLISLIIFFGILIYLNLKNKKEK